MQKEEFNAVGSPKSENSTSKSVPENCSKRIKSEGIYKKNVPVIGKILPPKKKGNDRTNNTKKKKKRKIKKRTKDGKKTKKKKKKKKKKRKKTKYKKKKKRRVEIHSLLSARHREISEGIYYCCSTAVVIKDSSIYKKKISKNTKNSPAKKRNSPGNDTGGSKNSRETERNGKVA